MIRYTTKQGNFETNNHSEIPLDKLQSLNDEPAIENLIIGYKAWHFEGKCHRETGPAVIWSDGKYEFWLNGKWYKNINDWLENHINKDIIFQAFMRLKYT